MLKSVSKIFKTSICLLLCLVFMLSLTTAFAQETEETKESIIDGEELQKRLDDYIASKNLNPENISIGYCYTATGDTWYYNGDKWYYSASMYKVPLFMLMAEGEHEGKLTQDSDIRGMKLSELERLVLVYSNNDYGHLTMNYIADVPYETPEGNRKVREMYQRYSDMPKEDYVDDFYDYSYFNARFMTDVMKTLYFENERFPNIIECLKQAQPDTYFNRTLGDKYEIAQKYGALVDRSNKSFSHTAGIIYTPNPFILTVMTEQMGLNDDLIAGFAPIFEEYTLSLDEKLEAYEKEQAEAEQKRLEEEKKAQEEQERIEKEKQEEEARQALEEQQRIEQEKLAAEKAEKKDALLKKILVIAGVIGAVTIAAGAVSLILKAKKNKPEEEAEQIHETVKANKEPKVVKTPRAPKTSERENNKSNASKGKYQPKH